MTINEGIYDIREILASYSMDKDISNRYIYHLMVEARRTVLRQFIQRNPWEIRDELLQTFTQSLETTDKGLVRAVNPLPPIIGPDVLKHITITTEDPMFTEIQVISKYRAINIKGSNSGFLYAFLDNDRYIYLVAKEPVLLKNIVISAIFENPKDLENITGKEITDFYFPKRMWTQAKSIILSNFQGLKDDVINNETED